MAVKVSPDVAAGLEAVRSSGATNMFDKPAVVKLAAAGGYWATVDWLRRTKEYGKLIMEGMEVE